MVQTLQKIVFSEINNNLIKSTTYSIDEQVIGTWINGKPLYRIVFSIGTLPNATRKVVDCPSNVKGKIENVISLRGFAKYNTDGSVQNLPHITAGSNNSFIGIWYVNNAVVVETGANRTDGTGVVIMEYTKID